MSGAARDPRVDAYLERSELWTDEIARLRPILLDAGLTEALKWGKPCYSHDGKNIAIVQEMKEFLSLMFFKGALMDDPVGILEEQGEHTRSARRIVFRSMADVDRRAGAVRTYLEKAVEVERSGRRVEPPPPLELVAELQARLDTDAELAAAFRSLTPGRQREYHLYISGAKQATTREARVTRHVDRIKAGKGLRDR